jgi:mannose-6-phosphate isomerase-like protein (cupin superfamily)
MTVPQTSGGYALKHGEGRAVWFFGGLLTWKAVGRDTEGRYEFVEQWGKRGFAAPVHLHEREAEAFYVLDGEMTFVLGNKNVPATAGSFLYVPQQTKHAFVIESEDARFLALASPSGLEPFVNELGKPAKALTLPPPSESMPSPQQIEAAALKHGQKFFGPPPTPGPKQLKKIGF